MKPRSEMSMELYEMMLDRGYPEEFCDLISKNLNTDFTAGRMMGYLSHYQACLLRRLWMRCCPFSQTGTVSCRRSSLRATMPSGTVFWRKASDWMKMMNNLYNS